MNKKRSRIWHTDAEVLTAIELVREKANMQSIEADQKEAFAIATFKSRSPKIGALEKAKSELAEVKKLRKKAEASTKRIETLCKVLRSIQTPMLDGSTGHLANDDAR